jgi:hypothetical protein
MNICYSKKVFVVNSNSFSSPSDIDATSGRATTRLLGYHDLEQLLKQFFAARWALVFGQGFGTGHDTGRYWHRPRHHLLPISADRGEDVPAKRSPMDDWEQTLPVIVVKQYSMSS